jgi:bleomycin hydrolase
LKCGTIQDYYFKKKNVIAIKMTTKIFNPIRFSLLLLWGGMTFNGLAQTNRSNAQGSLYRFELIKQHEALPVQSQDRSLTCWSFSTLSFFESELLRMGKGSHKLSEMFVARHAYMGKGDVYVRLNGAHTLAGGGAFHDIPWVIKRHGIVPQSVYTGLNYGLETHNHTELDAVLKGVADAVKDNPQKSLTPAWRRAYDGVLDAYFGKLPETFNYQGKSYTAKSFADFLGLKMDDYVSLSSFTHHPFYEKFVLEVPDNWSMASSINLPLDELMEVMEQALLKGYTFAWAADISEKGFSHKQGLAIVPAHDSMVRVMGKDSRVFDSPELAARSGYAFVQPMPELTITQELRQKAFDAQETTDDHGMHITGIVKDQNGTKYFIVKNSWGTKNNDCDGYLYASWNYVRYKTLNIYVHKDAIPKNIAKKINDF